MDIKQIEKEFDEFIDKLFSRAEIPNYANDAKQPIKSFYRQQIKELEREARILELDILQKHIKEQMGFYDTINKSSLEGYIETAKKHIKND